MKPISTIRNFAYAALLALTALSFSPTPAAAQPVQGRFTLRHDVHWGKAVVTAGEYKFSFDPSSSQVLVLSRLGGSSGGFLILVPATEDAKSFGLSQLMLESTSDGSYVSAMQLPEFGITLDFDVPSHLPERQIAAATAALR